MKIKVIKKKLNAKIKKLVNFPFKSLIREMEAVVNAVVVRMSMMVGLMSIWLGIINLIW